VNPPTLRHHDRHWIGNNRSGAVLAAALGEA
jgi:hypothetical protein